MPSISDEPYLSISLSLSFSFPFSISRLSIWPEACLVLFLLLCLSRRQIRNKFVGNASSYLTSSETTFDFHEAPPGATASRRSYHSASCRTVSRSDSSLQVKRMNCKYKNVHRDFSNFSFDTRVFGVLNNVVTRETRVCFLKRVKRTRS